MANVVKDRRMYNGKCAVCGIQGQGPCWDLKSCLVICLSLGHDLGPSLSPLILGDLESLSLPCMPKPWPSPSSFKANDVPLFLSNDHSPVSWVKTYNTEGDFGRHCVLPINLSSSKVKSS